MSLRQRLTGGLLALAACSTLGATEVEKKNYRLYCMGCHQLDGAGSPVNGIPAMRDQVGHFLRAPGGRAYLSQVPGTLNTPLGDKDTAALLNWVLANIGRGSVPADFTPYSADEVARYRASVPEDIPGLRARLMDYLERQERGR